MADKLLSNLLWEWRPDKTEVGFCLSSLVLTSPLYLSLTPLSSGMHGGRPSPLFLLGPCWVALYCLLPSPCVCLCILLQQKGLYTYLPVCPHQTGFNHKTQHLFYSACQPSHSSHAASHGLFYAFAIVWQTQKKLIHSVGKLITYRVEH